MSAAISLPRTPRMNAHCERIIGSIRREALDHVLIMNDAHARHVLAAYERHYNQHRPHQARNQVPPNVHEQPAAVHDLPVSDVCASFPNSLRSDELWPWSAGCRRNLVRNTFEQGGSPAPGPRPGFRHPGCLAGLAESCHKP
ncbi:putative transposase [Streptomyces bingchenggensis BCW-1]|uniref:Putative transposase n=1 Tax=Streptomyces bingchenggensis (strain BCW-1) TaxID=749414 RepID=D7CC01_STRBB|nr:putative transposase [Streptomyces bingchenggensis BCW-1]